MKNREVLDYCEQLLQGGGLKPIKLSGLFIIHKLSKNMDKLEKVARHIKPETLMPESKEYKEYTDKIRTLYAKHSKGKTKMVGGREIMDIEGNEKAFAKDVQSVNKEYAKAIEERQKQIDDYNEFLEKETDEKIEIDQVTVDDVEKHNPNIDMETYSLIKWMIKD